MRKSILVISLLLCACTTPQTNLINKKTGEEVTCGGSQRGSAFGGAIGYHIEKSMDADCVREHLEQGFTLK